jgi:SAM-dependent methyltransferase
MRSSVPLYDALAASYDDHFAVPHRRAYDELAWDLCLEHLPSPPATIVDVGCGVGRWSERLVGLGHRVVGVEPAPNMAAHAVRRMRDVTETDFTLEPHRIEDVTLEPASVDAVLAMGSLQYSEDPYRAVRRAAGWLRPGGVLMVLVDSLKALVLELIDAGREDEALLRLATRRGVWTINGLAADLHLLDVRALVAAIEAAGLQPLQLAGLLVGATAYGRNGLMRRLEEDFEATVSLERRLARCEELADLGKQLLVVARRP